ncbi:DUF411 domain-containing protein [Brevundimonas sp.]|uniref:DUF411 domain-containing protein n=1 Tax=Brevundimonas sp. TaxID=1871086 RepID=UPI001831B631|nr:DUF411 domain-containing protein [Brevundimonas sp.]MBA3051228.1 DUF411 domain-containing protein [Brevundimonas sp.]MBU3971758.1 DUF411 domain-containing protein [Alphaproteobacteria bacterium]MBU4039577.1 DUF411 domain-containing protein [Alphaproteobacteria bacterium]MBU4137886.1 DUF411 domain-containing protein [Alphaproteobacteria bacterium]
MIQTRSFPTRRALLVGLPLAAMVGAANAAPDKRMTAYKTPWCGCCGGWIAHMRQAGWTVEVIEREDLAPIRARHGVPDRLASCHTAVVGAYAIEGHVPAGDVDRLLRERPAARALSAPGMPGGSPGMEAAEREPYTTVLILNDGSTRVFGRHNGA